ncbi:DJ-1/PfpI family protein [Shinella sedimenti]|uniref:DJ-1/PfpI family protein n=1 Tax=Shinella sedimenti TaxID=2919913 RepID=A0ABT0CHX8_9HYPH|nr:DJ-1/PfpI family protein [Shinella sedimenti]MCJ8148228.1 DJ-1/PfpI family protein [Shinella sedimenti]
MLTPGGHDVPSLGDVCVRASGKAEDAEPDDLDALVLCGATIWERGDAPDLSAPVRRFVAVGRPVAGICDATVALGRIALLDDRTHTGNHPGQLRDMVPDYRGAALYRNQPRAVRDRGVITASGAASVSFAREIQQAVGLGSSGLVDYLDMYGNEHRAAAG